MAKATVKTITITNGVEDVATEVYEGTFEAVKAKIDALGKDITVKVREAIKE